jgi:hypothetical protein
MSEAAQATPKSSFSQLNSAKYVGSGLAKPAPGQVVAVSGDRVIQPVITHTSIDTKIALSDQESMVLFAQEKSGQTRPLTKESVIQVFNDSAARVEVTGFSPNSPVEAWLFSTPVRLGSGYTNAEGNFSGEFAISENIPVGRHSLQINGVDKDGQVTSVVVALDKQAPVANLDVVQAQATSSSAGEYLLIGFPLLLLIIFLIVFRKKRS